MKNILKAIAVDDEPLALTVIQNFCSEIDNINLLHTFIKPSDALDYLENFEVDLIILDVNMPSISGVDFFRNISKLPHFNGLMAIFSSAHSNFAIEGFDLNAIDYILKPFTFERFEKAITKAHQKFESTYKTDATKNDFIMIKANYKLNKLKLDDILLIEGLDDYLKIYLENDKPLIARITMKAMEEKLPLKYFLRVHRSFIVPVSKISSIHNKTIRIKDFEIPVGTKYYVDFENVILNNFQV